VARRERRPRRRRTDGERGHAHGCADRAGGRLRRQLVAGRDRVARSDRWRGDPRRRDRGPSGCAHSRDLDAGHQRIVARGARRRRRRLERAPHVGRGRRGLRTAHRRAARHRRGSRRARRGDALPRGAVDVRARSTWPAGRRRVAQLAGSRRRCGGERRGAGGGERDRAPRRQGRAARPHDGPRHPRAGRAVHGRERLRRRHLQRRPLLRSAVRRRLPAVRRPRLRREAGQRSPLRRRRRRRLVRGAVDGVPPLSGPPPVELLRVRRVRARRRPEPVPRVRRHRRRRSLHVVGVRPAGDLPRGKLRVPRRPRVDRDGAARPARAAAPSLATGMRAGSRCS
jgi:hypothetical protein